MQTLIVGCGYLGHRVARAWQTRGHAVHVVTRSAQRAEQFAAEGLLPHVADVLQPDTLRALPSADVVLFAVGYDRRAGVPIHDVYVDGLRHLLDALNPLPRRLIYISSTGVYGDAEGDWVDEQTLCVPLREGGKACLAAEHLLAAAPWSDRSVVLRLAGIYGPGRIPRVGLLLRGEPIPAVAQGYLNLIHVDDAVRVVLAAAARAPGGSRYVVSDGNPAVRGDYYRELARLVGASEPQFFDPTGDSHQLQRAAADKRACNQRLLRELGVSLVYPSFREGLAACVQALSGDSEASPNEAK